jgi:hypothetical protein
VLTRSALVGSGSYKLEPEVLSKQLLVRVPVLSSRNLRGGVVLKISLGEVRFFLTGTGGSLTGLAGTRTTTRVPVSKTLNRRPPFWFGFVFCRLPVRRASSHNNSRSCFFSFHFFRHQFRSCSISTRDLQPGRRMLQFVDRLAAP